MTSLIEEISSIPMKDVLAGWGALLSSGLTVIKIFEALSDRRRFEIGYNFAPADHGGNEIVLYNPSKFPVMIKSWELLKTQKPFERPTAFMSRFCVEGGDIEIPAYSKQSLIFEGENHFSTHYNKMRKLYIRLYIAGRRRPIKIFIFKHYISPRLRNRIKELDSDSI